MFFAETAKIYLADFLWKGLCFSNADSSLTGAELNDFRRDGILARNNFLSAQQCDDLVGIADNLYTSRRDLVSVESNGADERIYGVDNLHSSFRLEKELGIGDNFHRDMEFSIRPEKFLLLGRIRARGENLGSGSGWHRDSAFSHQFKILLYLTDVTEDNGPFEYIPGSHRSRAIRHSCKQLGCSLSKFRFADNEVAELEQMQSVRERVSLVGPKGTLIFADTRGLHRGKPQVQGSRYAITRYYFGRGISGNFKKLYPLLGKSPAQALA